MPISKEQVAHVAELAGLNLTPDEQEKFSHELSRIIDYMAQLREIDADDIEVRGSVVAQGPAFRDDVAGESLPVDDVMRNAPEKRDTCFIVPRVM